jgi:hypothetical protein
VLHCTHASCWQRHGAVLLLTAFEAVVSMAAGCRPEYSAPICGSRDCSSLSGLRASSLFSAADRLRPLESSCMRMACSV